jgi:hypothetical protein
MQAVKALGMAALAVRFIVELVGVGAAAYWGWQTGPDGVGQIALAAGAAVVFIVVWAFVVAPKADNPLSQQARDVIGTGLLLVAAIGVAAAGRPDLAVAFAAIVAIDWLALVAIGPDVSQALRSPAASRR